LFTDPGDKNASYARELETNIGIRMMTTFDILGAASGLNGVPKRITRMDMIFGIKVFRPEWCVRIRTAIPS